MLNSNSKSYLFASILLLVFICPSQAKVVCPFCSAIGPTLSEQFQTSKYALVAKLVAQRTKETETGALVLWGDLEILEIMNEGPRLKVGQSFEMQMLTREKVGTKVLLFGQDQTTSEKIRWAAPKLLDRRSAAFVKKMRGLPNKGIQRLTFFMSRLNDENQLIADDAFNEFSQATYQDLLSIRESIDRKQIMRWITDTKTPTERIRLYYTMLGVCADASDAEVLESLLKSNDPQHRRGLDSLVACYLLLKGKKGLDVIDEALIKNKATMQTDLFACVGALRFHGTDVDVIPKDRLLRSARLLLDRPEIADVIITDLARWKDWSVADKLLQFFTSDDEKHQFMRVSIAAYFLSFPNDKSAAYIEKLKQKDSKAFERAEAWLAWENGKEEF